MENVGLMVALAGAMTKAPSSEQVASAVDSWLEDHPEATTTVTDGAITNAKLASSFVTPGTAAAYSSSATYAVGDYAFHGGALYRCTTAITTAEAWTAAHWALSTLSDDINLNILRGNSMYAEELELTTTDYRALHPSTGLPYETGAASYHIRKASVIPGQSYLLNASTRGSSASCFYAFFNDADAVVLKGPNSDVYESATVQNLRNQFVVAPAGASYVMVADVYSGETVYGIIGSVKKVLPAVNAINEKIAAHEYVDDYHVDITSDITKESGYLDKTTGRIVSYASAETTEYIDIDKYPHLYVSGSPLYSSNAFWAIYADDFSVLYVYRNNTLETDYDFARETILSDYPTAKYVRFSSVFAGAGIHLVIKRSSFADEAAAYAVNNIASAQWKGKKWACLGDSLTEVNSRTTKHYFDYVSEKTGINVVNLGKSGRGYKNPDSVSGSNKTFNDVVSDVPTDSDVVTIFGSGNDLTHSYTLGAPSDTGTTTICGCINTTLDSLIARIPEIQLGIVSPTPWENFPPSTADNAMEQYVEALQTICANRSIPFLDLYHCSNLRPWTEEGRTACYSKDDGNGVHPDEAGHKIIASRFGGFLNFLII